ncbi:D-erythrulose reductase [Colletotrichum sojae]|uniref:D-erythrulose reductase n=1 Tax=Colletotrichum sojae TaxID=2175907 RepID=A0A8H6JLX4_9PEZI|nr:D-erythrulose reductase [Colletotrichum sojae]
MEHYLNLTSTVENGSTLVKTIHKKGYPAIDPSRPELSQTGRTVLITGGSGGIGFAIARGFAQAGAAHVIITGRRANALDESVAKLRAEFPGGTTKFSGRAVEVSDLVATEKLWKGFEDDDIVVDVLALNAASFEALPILDQGVDKVWAQFEVNVRGHLDYTERFYHQKKAPEGHAKFLVNTSTAAIHDFIRSGPVPSYSLTKNSGTLLLQQIAKDTPPEKMQVVSFHPGTVYTDGVVGFIPRDAFDFDEDTLGGHFAVWAASEEARFLHGRYVWAGWDLDELRNGEVYEKITKNPHFLQIGVVGLHQ